MATEQHQVKVQIVRQQWPLPSHTCNSCLIINRFIAILGSFRSKTVLQPLRQGKTPSVELQAPDRLKSASKLDPNPFVSCPVIVKFYPKYLNTCSFVVSENCMAHS